MTDILTRRPNDILAERLPPMEPKFRDELIELAKVEAYKVLVERAKALGAQEQAARKKRPGEALGLSIARAEKRIERRLLAMLETSLKAEHGGKSWSRRQALSRLAGLRRTRKQRAAATPRP